MISGIVTFLTPPIIKKFTDSVRVRSTYLIRLYVSPSLERALEWLPVEFWDHFGDRFRPSCFCSHNIFQSCFQFQILKEYEKINIMSEKSETNLFLLKNSSVSFLRHKKKTFHSKFIRSKAFESLFINSKQPSTRSYSKLGIW